MPKVKFKLQSNFQELKKQWKNGFQFAAAKAITATVNEVIKYTLPSSPTTNKEEQHGGRDYNKVSASKTATMIKGHLKALRKRIKMDILGGRTKNDKDGNQVQTWQTKTGIPSGIPANKDGIIAHGTKRGFIKAGYIVLRQSKGKKAKKVIQPVNFTSSVQELIKHIRKSTILYKKGGKVATRIKRRKTKLLWIDSPETAIQAANIMSQNAGGLLSGWRSLQSKILQIKGMQVNGKNDLLGKVLIGVNTKNKKKGHGTIQQTDEMIHIQATNTNVDKSVQRYQQEVVNKTVKHNLEKHFKNEMYYFQKKIEKDIQKNTKLKVEK